MLKTRKFYELSLRHLDYGAFDMNWEKNIWKMNLRKWKMLKIFSKEKKEENLFSMYTKKKFEHEERLNFRAKKW